MGADRYSILDVESSLPVTLTLPAYRASRPARVTLTRRILSAIINR